MMANIDEFIPILLRWEASITVKEGESLEAAYKRAAKKGFVNDPDDTGGATMVGVTIGTYTQYCKNKGLKTPTIKDLQNMSYSTWKDVVYTMYWNKWKADTIED
jgi:lysozyme family protein